MDITPTPLPPNRVIGDLCPKHPELKGLRRARNRECIGCRKDYRQNYKADPDRRLKQAQERKANREAGRVAALMAERKMAAIRIRATELASARTQNVARWQEFYAEAREEVERGS